ncbi:MAG TPA: SPOR domain-containing protein [Pseudomonadales bacterium]|nr:SPOR domain-containing protein [Pseudomonadales bacterium]
MTIEQTEAEKLRNKMSRLGVSTSVRVISDANGAALQKVLAGPFRSSAEADNARTILSGNGISTIAVK